VFCGWRRKYAALQSSHEHLRRMCHRRALQRYDALLRDRGDLRRVHHGRAMRDRHGSSLLHARPPLRVRAMLERHALHGARDLQHEERNLHDSHGRRWSEGWRRRWVSA
jgi:hypothetical protein